MSITAAALLAIPGLLVGGLVGFALRPRQDRDLLEIAQNEGGKISFKKFTYSDSADEWYVISEQPKDGFNCDSKKVLAHVVVTKGNDNQLTPKVTYIVDGKESGDPVTFENKVAPVTTTLNVKKLVNGDSSIATDRDFTFSLHC